MIRRKRKSVITINLNPKDIGDRQPGIYIHYLEGRVQYVGETVNVFDGRPFRASRNEPVDKIRWLRASQDNWVRKKWEAYLVCKLKPARQNVRQYEGSASRAGYVLSQKELRKRHREEQIKFTRRVIDKLRLVLHEYSISQKGYVPLNKYEIRQKCKYAYYDSISITNKIMNNEDKMSKWHNDVLFNYCIRKRREIENSLFGPLQ